MTIEKLKEILALAKKAAESVPDQGNYSDQDIRRMLKLAQSLSIACMNGYEVRSELKDVVPPQQFQKFYRAARALKFETPYISGQMPHVKSYIKTIEEILEATIAREASHHPTKELEQKFKILLSQPQEQKDFDAWCTDAREYSFSIGVLFIDIDHFKNLNSKYTETKVDKTILPESQKLLKQLTNHRGGAYRHGGEEFVVLLPNHGIQESIAFAEKVRAAFETHKFQVDGTDEAVTVSIGVAIWPNDGENLSDVLAAANNAEHLAKHEGRNTVRIGARPHESSAQ